MNFDLYFEYFNGMLNSLGWKLWVYALLLVGYCDFLQNILAILRILFVWTVVGVGECIHAPAEGAPWVMIWMLVIRKGAGCNLPPSKQAVSQGVFCTHSGKVEIAIEGNMESPTPIRYPQNPLYFSVTFIAAVINYFNGYLFTAHLHHWTQL